MKKLLWVLLMFYASFALASQEVMVFASAEQEQTYRELTAQLRCPKCQNNSIADSNSMIATDMRQKVRALLQEGKSRQQIVDYMVARYGQFVTYDPPFTFATALLWLLPGAVIIAGCGVIYSRSRRRIIPVKQYSVQSKAAAPLSPFLLAPGVMLAAGLAVYCYLQTGSYRQVRAWQAAVSATPSLLARLENPQARPLNDEELKMLLLGLRTHLQQEPEAAQQWMLLARLATLTDDPETALHAWDKARILEPQNREALLGYVKGLTQSANPDDKRLGGELLRERIQAGEADFRILSLYAANALEQGHNDEAVKACRALLSGLGQNDPRRAMVETLLEQARRG